MIPSIPLRTSISQYQESEKEPSPHYELIEADQTRPPDDFFKERCLTSEELGDQFSREKDQAMANVCSDATTFLSAGFPAAEVEVIIFQRRGADFGVAREIIHLAVQQPAELLKQKGKGK